MIARALWNLRQFSKWVNCKNARAFLVQRPGSNQWPHTLDRCQLNCRCPTFTNWILDYLCVDIYLILILDGCSAPVTCWCVPTKRFSQGSERGRKQYSESEFVSSVSMRIKKRSNISVNRSDFDSRCKLGVSSSWIKFDFRFAIENSRSFNTVICSTNSSSHCLSRNAEHIRSTTFRWRCDKVELRGTCLEAQTSIHTKVVINSWKLYYDTEDTFSRNRTKGVFDIWRSEKVWL